VLEFAQLAFAFAPLGDCLNHFDGFALLLAWGPSDLVEGTLDFADGARQRTALTGASLRMSELSEAFLVPLGCAIASPIPRAPRAGRGGDGGVRRESVHASGPTFGLLDDRCQELDDGADLHPAGDRA
jgi:hypothetical protein